MGPGKSFHRQWSPSRSEHHVILYLHSHPSLAPFGPRMSRATPRRCNLPKGWLSSDPAVQCRQQAHYIYLAEVEKEKTHSPTPGHTCNPTGQPTSFQTLLRKIRLSSISYLSCGLHQAAGYEGPLIRPCTTLWCEKALKRFDSPLLRSRKLLAIIDIGFPC